MNTKPISEEKIVNNIYDDISTLIDNARKKVYYTANAEMLNLYWNIGKIIMNIQDGEERATYGNKILDKLSKKLTNEFGKGFSIIN